MASEIHEIEIARRLSTGTHLFVPPLTWNLAVVGSAAHLVHLIRQSGREAKIVAHPEWMELIPATWPKDLWVHPEEMIYTFAERPQWTWLWGLGHSKQHSQELNNFLLGLDSIQILDWTSDRVRRRGQYFHDCGYLGGLLELSFVISRDLWPVYNWNSTCLGDGLRYYMQQYPMTCQDAPLIHMAGRLQWSPLEAIAVAELAELRRHGDWAIQVYKNLSAVQLSELQLRALNFYQKESSKHLVLVLKDSQGSSFIQILTAEVELELKLRKCLLDKLSKHSLGGFDLEDVEIVMACMDEAQALDDHSVKQVRPWPSSNYTGDHFSFSCKDPQWEFERDQRLFSDELIEEEVPEDDAQEEAQQTLDWDANLLIQRLKHLKLPTLQLSRRDLRVAHLPVLVLEELDLRETQDRLEEEKLAAQREQMRLMLEAEAEQKRIEHERLEAEQRERELEAEKLRQAEFAQAQAAAELLAEQERQLAEQIQNEQQREEESANKNDYLHSDKVGWGEEEHEKDEDEQLLEAFNEIDREHSQQEQVLYDEEEKLDDSMGIEHPSFEMFSDEEDDDDDEQEDLLEEEIEDLEAEQLLRELEEVEAPSTTVTIEVADVAPEEILAQLEAIEQSPKTVDLMPASLAVMRPAEILARMDQYTQKVVAEQKPIAQIESVKVNLVPASLAWLNPCERFKRLMAWPVQEESSETTVVELVEDGFQQETLGAASFAASPYLSPEEILKSLDEYVEIVDSEDEEDDVWEADPEDLPPIIEVEVEEEVRLNPEEIAAAQMEEDIETIVVEPFAAEDSEEAIAATEGVASAELEQPEVSSVVVQNAQVESTAAVVYGRKTATGYLNPYLWDHHNTINELVTEVRQNSRFQKSDLGYLVILAMLLVWAHLNQVPFI